MTETNPFTTGEPRLTAILITGPRRAHAQAALDSLGAQSLREMEILLVDVEPDRPPLRRPAGSHLREVRCRFAGGQAEARTKAVGLARSRIVAFVEDHCVMSPGWAEAVAAAFASGPWSAVGYTFANANPGRWIARGGHAAVYGPWMAPGHDREVRDIAGNNFAVLRDLLLGLGDRLPGMLFPDSVLRQHLLSEGCRLFVAGSAVCVHEIPERLGYIFGTSRSHGRMMAVRRVEVWGWTWPRRLLYAVGVPLGVPLLRLWRLGTGVADQPAHWPAVLKGLPIALVIFVAAALGETQGYLFGAGRQADEYEDYELRLDRT